VEPEDFTIDQVRAIFLHLSDEYPTDDLLQVDALSTDGQVKKVVDWFARGQSFPFGNLLPFVIDDSPPEPRSAIYHRTDGSEGFLYFPAAGAGSSTNVEIKSPAVGCAPSGDTVVDLVDASMDGCTDVVRQLLHSGADPNVKTRHGGFALVEASQRGMDEIVKLLLEAGADINQTSSAGWTPLIAAISGNNSTVIELLLRHGANVNVRSRDGRTGIILAVMKGNAAAVKDLLARGADVHVIDGYGKTPLAIAEERHDQELIPLLKEAGATR
jgi:hypothetical protein